MKTAICACAWLLVASAMTAAQEAKDKQEAPAPRSREGKKLFGTA